MDRGLFVTGTDTGVGKTVVAAGVLRSLRKRGLDVVPMKPVQTGAAKRGGKLFAPDLEFCLETIGLRPSPDELQQMSPFLYEPACSPHLAGKLAGNCASIATIVDSSKLLLEKHDAIIVEGAGGVMVPLNESETMLDLMKAFAFPVVLVSRIGLGSINHCLLSLHALRSARLHIVGVIFNQPETPVPQDRYIEEDNPPTVGRFGDIDVLGNVRHVDPNVALPDRWTDFESSVPRIGLLRRMLEVSDA